MEFLGLSTSQWVDLGVSVLIGVGAAVIGRVLVAFLFDGGGRRLTRRTRTGLDDVILKTTRAPTYWLIVVLALRVAVQRLDFVPAVGDNWLGDTFTILYMLIGFIFAWRLVSSLFTWYSQEVAQHTSTELDEQLLPFFRRVVLILLSVIAFITLLSQLDVDVSAFVTTLGIGSLAIALAAQATLADTISGFVIMIDRPFRIGDRIEILELNTWGDVVDIGLRSSRIRTRDNRMVIVPNSVIGKSLVVNYSYPDTQYRIQIHVGVAYGADVELARQTMIEAVRDVEGVLPDRPVEALFLEFGDSAMIFRVRWWLESYVDTRRMFDRVNTALHKALDEAGIVLPAPQHEVFHKIAPGDVEQIAGVLRGPSR
jgi:small-conductance mechanosensitive channel